MNWIKRLIQKRKQTVALKKLTDLDVKFTRTRIGAPIFLTNESISASGKTKNYDTVFSHEFTSNQFRAMADYIDAFPDSTKVLSED